MPHTPTRIIDAWNGWYHLNGNTRGTWLRGGARGWRARHHREHVEGDYKNPPPLGTYDALRRSSERLMARAGHDEVLLTKQCREIACNELVASLFHQAIEVIACAVDDHHFHILAKFKLTTPDEKKKPMGSNPWASSCTKNQPIYAHIRHVVGLAKSRASRVLSHTDLMPEGGVWGKRFKITAIADRKHQTHVFEYIKRHQSKGACVWTFRNQKPTSLNPLALATAPK